MTRGTGVRILKTDHVEQCAPECVGMSGVIAEVPTHPNTWFKIKVWGRKVTGGGREDGRSLSLRPSAFQLLAGEGDGDGDGDRGEIVPAVNEPGSPQHKRMSSVWLPSESAQQGGRSGGGGGGSGGGSGGSGGSGRTHPWSVTTKANRPERSKILEAAGWTVRVMSSATYQYTSFDLKYKYRSCDKAWNHHMEAMTAQEAMGGQGKGGPSAAGSGSSGGSGGSDGSGSAAIGGGATGSGGEGASGGAILGDHEGGAGEGGGQGDGDGDDSVCAVCFNGDIQDGNEILLCDR